MSGTILLLFALAAAFLAATKPGLLKQRAAGQGP